jgi:XRE family aerobic/anaerobic benzoate catabolism transcriptional regulator
MVVGEKAFLGRLGARLRSRREEQGLSLAELARRTGLSRRYLTEAEAGRANLSMGVLLELAEALGSRPSALLAGADERPRERIALLGLRGAGKSTVGRELARLCEAPFVELDALVEERAGLALRELFELHGAEAFERYEAEALEQVLSRGERLVLATGGSLVTHAATFQRLRETCSTVWLRAEPEEHFARVLGQGDRRPMDARPRAMDELRAILAAREALYARCDHVVTTSEKHPLAIAREVRSQLGIA